MTEKIKILGKQLGFQQVGISNTDAGEHIERYKSWIQARYHGEMDYMERHGSMRYRPDELVDGTLTVISLRMDYLSPSKDALGVLNNREKAYISRYTLGRDYHKLIRSRLKKMITEIKKLADEFQFRAFVDSAPVLERAFAQQAGLGWFGKNAMILNRSAGSFFFLGELFTNLPLIQDAAFDKQHCGTCTACLDKCPTDAFVGPYILDSRRCISYLTIEKKGSIPEELRSLMGNRIFGCDDCQLVCPWNRFAKTSSENDFEPRHHLDNQDLIDLFAWDEATFLDKTEGSAIRRAGYESWLRNIAIALGNAPGTIAIIEALKNRRNDPSPIVREHVEWALKQHRQSKS